MNKITVLFFATLRDKTGTRSIELEVPDGISIGELKIILEEKYPNVKGFMPHSLAAINHEYKFDEALIPTRAEVALFPHVSGG